MNKQVTPPGGTGVGGRLAGSRKEDWIGDHLRHVYDDALQEDIPDEMLALLNKLDERQEDS